MADRNYTTTIIVDQSPAKVFDAINNVRGWWSEEIEGHADKAGETFKCHFQDLHRYGACTDGWRNYINGSLKDLITTGRGQPNKGEAITERAGTRELSPCIKHPQGTDAALRRV